VGVEWRRPRIHDIWLMGMPAAALAVFAVHAERDPVLSGLFTLVVALLVVVALGLVVRRSRRER
jgi:hypothetical protein